jgi:hypothetical protein
MKNFGLPSGNSSSWALAGRAKSLMIGMMSRSTLKEDEWTAVETTMIKGKSVLCSHDVVDDTIIAFFVWSGIGVNQFCFAAPHCSAVESAAIHGSLLILFLLTLNAYFEWIHVLKSNYWKEATMHFGLVPIECLTNGRCAIPHKMPSDRSPKNERRYSWHQ